jgi:hypothetical protein
VTTTVNSNLSSIRRARDAATRPHRSPVPLGRPTSLDADGQARRGTGETRAPDHLTPSPNSGDSARLALPADVIRRGELVRYVRNTSSFAAPPDALGEGPNHHISE